MMGYIKDKNSEDKKAILVYGYELGRDGFTLFEYTDKSIVFKNKETGEEVEFMFDGGKQNV